ncbi:unnamed protein product, partial [Allacma fusca]
MEKPRLTGLLNGLLILYITFQQVQSQGSFDLNTQIFKNVEHHFQFFREKWLMLHEKKEDGGEKIREFTREFKMSNILRDNLESEIFLNLILDIVTKSCSDH